MEGSENGELPAALLPIAAEDLAALQDAPRYAINLKIDLGTPSFEGTAGVHFTNVEGIPLERLYFRLLPNGDKSYGDGSLTVTDVKVDGQPAETALSLNDTVLAIDLRGPLNPGQGVELDFKFQGKVPVDFGGDNTPSGYGIYNWSDGVLALSSWYPILAVYDDQGWNLDEVSALGDSVYSDIAFYSVDINAPSDLVIAATGVQTGRTVSGETARLHFESGPARDFFIIASPDFQVVYREVDGTQVNAYYLPGHERAGDVALSVASDSLHIFNQQFGPYPYTELDIVEAPMRNALGVEFPAIVLLRRSLYDAPDNPDFIVTLAHEVAHQWWYGVVGSDVFEEPWLDEALTTYSSSLYYEHKAGQEALQGLYAYWQDRYDRSSMEAPEAPITGGMDYFEQLNPRNAYGAVVYNKGALFFKALRQEIGDQAFFEALRDYYGENRFDIATGRDLLGAFENAAGRDLEPFYQDWLFPADR
jgi:aminopeptidase N